MFVKGQFIQPMNGRKIKRGRERRSMNGDWNKKEDDNFYAGTVGCQRMFVKGSSILKPMKGTLRGREWRSMKGSGKGQE